MKIRHEKQFHSNGFLAYEQTILTLPKSSDFRKYDLRVNQQTGEEWIRVGRCAKYFDNGQLAWVLNYDNFGNCIKEKNASYRKDGTIINK